MWNLFLGCRGTKLFLCFYWDCLVGIFGGENYVSCGAVVWLEIRDRFWEDSKYFYGYYHTFTKESLIFKGFIESEECIRREEGSECQRVVDVKIECFSNDWSWETGGIIRLSDRVVIIGSWEKNRILGIIG